MPTVAQCAKCQRTYMVVGPHSPTTMDNWICPRCKRGRNLPREVDLDRDRFGGSRQREAILK